jgi:hypothetical protein
VFTTSNHFSVSWARLIQLCPPVLFLEGILSQLCLGLPGGYVPAYFPTKTLLHLSSPHTCNTFGWSNKFDHLKSATHEALYYVVCSSPLLPLPSSTHMSSAHCSWMSQYIFFPSVRDQVSHPDVLFIMWCVVFIFEYSLLFFMQHYMLEVTYFFPYFCASCMYVMFFFIMVAKCHFLINDAMSCCQKWMVEWHVGHNWWQLRRRKLSSVPLLWMEADGFYVSFGFQTFG